MVLETHLYDILSVEPAASTEDIARAYKKQALRCHPDKTNHDPELTEKFKEMTHAYEILREKKSRDVYDAYGLAGVEGNYQEPKSKPPRRSQSTSTSNFYFNPGFPGMGMDMGTSGFSSSTMFTQVFNDINSMFASQFTGVPPNNGAHPANMKKHVEPVGSPLDQEYVRGKDIHHTCNANLADMYFGKTIKLQLPKNSKCKMCKGVGGLNPKTCRQCQGLGTVKTTYFNQTSQYQLIGSCKPCAGTGLFISQHDSCPSCVRGYVTEKKIIKINVLPGSNNGDKIILQGEADEGRNIIPGDVVIHLREIAHPFLVRKFNDLFMEHEIDLRTALLGGEVLINNFVKPDQSLRVFINVHGHQAVNESIDGNIQYGEITGTINSDQPKLVKGFGMPINEMVNGGEYFENLNEVDEYREIAFDLKRYKRGNLFINFKVKLPTIADFANGESDLQQLLNILPSTNPPELPRKNIMETYLSNLPGEATKPVSISSSDSLPMMRSTTLWCGQMLKIRIC
ncbi:DnaJ-domain-containing protein [Suhomyces tanzawaensis NRRL Y-17324]|uniref:DnaJ-domain-containing protein n=1 Tax=Suhomyces tanzawaensis NRRL Y-17324 TaxID=984487 RepID=A0A1E4SLP2_9ASCO|nr:DnaJ-domain-containing protein [Suhomyces tanzawaensis NRRL Y-17324]ODV80302.1 DnaJ-domain-containing protein [Suhomyces tanzawaensis NRRL Y-17324]